jgi:hypothetical protein
MSAIRNRQWLAATVAAIAALSVGAVADARPVRADEWHGWGHHGWEHGPRWGYGYYYPPPVVVAPPPPVVVAPPPPVVVAPAPVVVPPSLNVFIPLHLW